MIPSAELSNRLHKAGKEMVEVGARHKLTAYQVIYVYLKNAAWTAYRANIPNSHLTKLLDKLTVWVSSLSKLSAKSKPTAEMLDTGHMPE